MYRGIDGMGTIAAPVVGQKINEWYRHIKRLNVTDAEILRNEVKNELDLMEEDEQVVLYFQLMEFRHEQMLEYVNPSKNTVNKADYLRAVEGEGKRLTGIMEYYFNFFRGMYEFSKGEYIKAITFYRYAERKLDKVADELERAEFFFKMAEIFYHMKQTHLSMYYVEQAYHAYKANSIYQVRLIQCRFVIAGNYDDLVSYEKALPHLKLALQESIALGHDYITTKGLLNLGNCFNKQDDVAKATVYYQRALELGEKIGAKEVVQACYDLAIIFFKQGRKEEALDYCEKGKSYAEKYDDYMFVDLFNVLHELYVTVSPSVEVNQKFDQLLYSRGYPYLEDLALEAGRFYNDIERLDDSVFFYKKMIQVQKLIQRGDFEYDV